MYNLVRFIVRYALLIFFIFLESFCAFLIYNNSRFHKAAFINRSNAIAGKAFDSYSSITQYLTLGKVNDSLAAENAYLKAKNIESLSIIQNQYTTVHDTLGRTLQVYTYNPAKVIKNSINQSANYIYINKGSFNNIKPQMGVIVDRGIVGQVVDVTENYAAVMSVLNKNFRASAKLKNSDFFGQLFWEGNSVNTLKLEEIPKHVPVKIGDTVLTSGYSILFPEGVMVGRVTKINAEPEKNFLEIDVKLSADMTNLSYVYVVDHLYKSELQKLDTTTQKLNQK